VEEGDFRLADVEPGTGTGIKTASGSGGLDRGQYEINASIRMALHVASKQKSLLRVNKEVTVPENGLRCFSFGPEITQSVGHVQLDNF
jgi:hypothetical protein